MGHVAGEARVPDRAHDGRIVEFLRRVDLRASGDAAGVVVADPVAGVGQGADDVPLHDLHVVDIVEDAHTGRVDGADDFEGVGHAVADVVDVSAGLGVERLHQDRDPFGLGDGGALAQAADRVLDGRRVGHAAAVAEEADHVGHALARRPRDVLLEGANDAGVVAGLVEAVLDGARTHVATRDHQAVVVRDRPFLHEQEVHGRQPHLRDRGAEGLQGDVLEAPAGHGLGEAGLGGFRMDAPAGPRDDQAQRGGAGCFQDLATCKVGHRSQASISCGETSSRHGRVRRQNGNP